ncbi:MAG: twin-arginine translocase subunit TatC [Bacteroidales bacterium]|nr:twin-arginine translocase subunit TatC [Bacteroidales bacterium]MCB8998647.1 twin-arginine translocase subunit TatC [Bacteroidales bacterium]MCB9012485.1 twin-arginine translocase subunit TatC [Bacteroidales bacterium]
MARKKVAEMSFLDHLEELRWRLIRSVLAIFVMAILAFVFKDIIFDKIILAPKSASFWTNRMFCELGRITGADSLCINQVPLEIISVKMAGQFNMHIMVSLIVGLITAFPYVFFEFWGFIRPALHSKEKRYANGAVFFSSVLFLIGVTFGYFMIVPLTVHFLGSYSVSAEVTNKINLISYVSTITSVVLAAGVVFELPVIVYFLTKVGIVTPEFMKKYRKHSIVVIMILAAIITPPDIFSQILVAIPLIILYEVSIGISKRIMKQRRKKEKAESES